MHLKSVGNVIPTYGSENTYSFLLRRAQLPFRVDPLSAILGRRRWGQPKSCFKSAENRVAMIVYPEAIRWPNVSQMKELFCSAAAMI